MHSTLILRLLSQAFPVDLQHPPLCSLELSAPRVCICPVYATHSTQGSIRIWAPYLFACDLNFKEAIHKCQGSIFLKTETKYKIFTPKKETVGATGENILLSGTRLC